MSSTAPALECTLCGRTSFVTMEDGLAAQKDPNYVKRCSCGGALVTVANDQEVAAMAFRVTSPPRHEALSTLTVDELVEQRIATIMGVAKVVGGTHASQSPPRRGGVLASAGGAVSLLAEALRDEGKRGAIARWIESLPVEHLQNLMAALSTSASPQVVSPPPAPLTGLADLFRSSPVAQSVGGGDSSPGASALQRRKQQRSVAKNQLFRSPTSGFGSSGGSSPEATAMQRRKAERAAQRAAPMGFSNSGSSSPGATAMQRRKAERAAQRAAPLAPSGGAPWLAPPMSTRLTRSERNGVFDPLARDRALEPQAQQAPPSYADTRAARYEDLARNEREQPAHLTLNSEYRSANSAVADIKAVLGEIRGAEEYLQEPLPPMRGEFVEPSARNPPLRGWTAEVPDAPTPSSPGATAMMRRKQSRSKARAAAPPPPPPSQQAQFNSSSPNATAMQRRKAERAYRAVPAGAGNSVPGEARLASLMQRIDADVSNFAEETPFGAPLTQSSYTYAPLLAGQPESLMPAGHVGGSRLSPAVRRSVPTSVTSSPLSATRPRASPGSRVTVNRHGSISINN